RKIIQLAKDSLFKDSPDPLQWYDGSGLSRYNQFTPRSIVHVLDKIYQEFPATYWQTIFPAGGKDGTIKGYFSGSNAPYIYAKSGSIRNIRCLSGFVLTQSGKTLLFSFMSNAIPGSSQPWNKEMEKILRWIHKEL
ncbi:MAG: D-alanyl-D-alanine carboxypeptidase, partial [Bacteroidota bacterium]